MAPKMFNYNLKEIQALNLIFRILFLKYPMPMKYQKELP